MHELAKQKYEQEINNLNNENKEMEKGMNVLSDNHKKLLEDFRSVNGKKVELEQLWQEGL
jgi:cell division protein FtsB